MAEKGYFANGPVTISKKDCLALNNNREVVDVGENTCFVGRGIICRIANKPGIDEIWCSGCIFNPNGFRCTIEYGK